MSQTSCIKGNQWPSWVKTHIKGFYKPVSNPNNDQYFPLLTIMMDWRGGGGGLLMNSISLHSTVLPSRKPASWLPMIKVSPHSIQYTKKFLMLSIAIKSYDTSQNPQKSRLPFMIQHVVTVCCGHSYYQNSLHPSLWPQVQSCGSLGRGHWKYVI